MKCPRCQNDCRPRAKFCEECGTPFKRPGDAPASSYTQLQSALTETQEQRTATAEILRVIASSPTDLQPVLDAVARSAERLCETVDAAIFRVDGDNLRLVAHHGVIPPTTPIGTLASRKPDSVNGRVAL